MGKMISKMFATGISKIYYKVENEFVATGTLFTNFGMYYTAAHPALGLWMCGMAVDNNIIVIGFVDWANITRIVIDRKNENVFVVLKSYEEALAQVDKSFKMLYKKAYSHQMSDTGEMAFVTPLDLWSGNILPYLSSVMLVEEKEENVKVSIWMQIVLVLVVILFVFVIVLKILSFFYYNQ